jgi:hypothetical protein
MRGIRGLWALVVVGCAFVLAGSAGANKPTAVPGDKQPPPAAALVGPPGPTGYEVVATALLALPADSQVFGEVSCSAGKVVWGGGVIVDSGDMAANMNSSYPNTTTKKSWRAYVSNATVDATTFSVWAVCAKQPAGYAIVKKTFANPAGLQSGGLTACAATATVLGGGTSSSSRSTLVNINSTYPYTVAGKFGWVTDMNNNSLSDATLTTYAICAKQPAPGGLSFEYVTDPAVPNPVGEQTPASASCHGGRVTISGGVLSTSKELQVNLNTSRPDSSGWGVWENNGSLIEQKLKPFVVCVA